MTNAVRPSSLTRVSPCRRSRRPPVARAGDADVDQRTRSSVRRSPVRKLTAAGAASAATILHRPQATRAAVRLHARHRPRSPSFPTRACASTPRCRARRSSRASSAPPPQLGRELRIPGFRKGKVPAPMVIQRMGREAVLEQAVRDSLPEWYEEAIMRSGVSTVGDPKLDLDGPAGRRRAAELLDRGRRHAEGHARRLQGARGRQREPEVPDEAIRPGARPAARVASRASRASTGRPSRATTWSSTSSGRVDGEPFEGGEARDYMLELGGGRLIEGFEEQLVGRERGRRRARSRSTFPDEYHAEELQGRQADVRGRGQGRQGEGAARARRRLRLRGERVRHARRAARRHRAQARARPGALDRGRVPRGGGRRGGRGGRASTCRTIS